MKVERSVDGLGGCYDRLRNDLTSKHAYQLSVSNLQGGTIHALAAHLSLLEGAASLWSGRG